MPEVFQALTWSVELPNGWTAEPHSDHVKIRLPFPRAELRITPYHDETGQLTADEWLRATEHFTRKRARPVIPRTCGDFIGHETRFAALDLWIRGWVLVADSHGLDIDYRCALGDAGRDDSAADAMLSTLRLQRAAT
jgi:hypothetical protein